jgi:hypothetical protein
MIACELRECCGPVGEPFVTECSVGAFPIPRTIVAQVKILLGGSGGMADDPIPHLEDVEETAQLVRAGRAARKVVAGYQASDGFREAIPLRVTPGETKALLNVFEVFAWLELLQQEVRGGLNEGSRKEDGNPEAVLDVCSLTVRQHVHQRIENAKVCCFLELGAKVRRHTYAFGERLLVMCHLG